MDKSGKVIAWRHRSAAPSIGSIFKADTDHAMPFDIPSVRCENPVVTAGTRIGWFRSVSNIPRAFAIQSMMAELIRFAL